jgi:hypothetical protein
MKVSPQANKGHLVTGILLVLLSLISMLAVLFLHSSILTFLIFFFGVWGGVETGRYLEHSLQVK